MFKCHLCYQDFDESRLIKSKKCNLHSYCIKCRSFLKSRHPENLLTCKDCNKKFKKKTKERFSVICQYFDKSCSECKKKQNKCSRVCKKHNICFFCLNKSLPSYEANKTQQCNVCLEVLVKACRICSLILSEKDIHYRSPCIIHIYCIDCITKKNDYTKCNDCLNYRPIEDTSSAIQYKKNRPTQINFDWKRTFEVTGDYELNNPIEIRKFYSPKTQNYPEGLINSKEIHSKHEDFSEVNHENIQFLMNVKIKEEANILDNPSYHRKNEINYSSVNYARIPYQENLTNTYNFSNPGHIINQNQEIKSDQNLKHSEQILPPNNCQLCERPNGIKLECCHNICVLCLYIKFKKDLKVFLDLIENRQFQEIEVLDISIRCPGINKICGPAYLCPFIFEYFDDVLNLGYNFNAREFFYNFCSIFYGAKFKFLECRYCRAITGFSSTLRNCYKCGVSLDS